MSGLLKTGDYVSLTKRKLTEETCRRAGYWVGRRQGKPVQVANIRNADGILEAQKVRYPDKDFEFIGKSDALYGMHLFKDGGNKIVITEGEVDFLTLYQLQDHRWPVVSLTKGAKGAKKQIAKNLVHLDKFKEVVLMFDMDEAGQEAAQECAALFRPGHCKVARLPLKDANDMHVAGRGDEVLTAAWEAKSYRPDGIVTIADIREDVLTPPEMGLPWWTPTLTKLTYGRQRGSVYCFGAGTGVGKTDFLTQQMMYDTEELGLPVGIFALEQKPAETVKRIAGKMEGKRFHVPEGGWTKEELSSALDKLEAKGKLFFYNNFGSMEWEVVRSTIRFLHHNEGVRIFYIDNLTAFAAEADDERIMLEQTMAQMAKLANELDIIIHLVSHLATPDGTPHEEGGRVMIRHFKGSRAIGYWCQFMFGLERNTQAEEKIDRTTTTFRVLKDRFTGESNGEMFYLGYNAEKVLLFETDRPPAKADEYGDDF